MNVQANVRDTIERFNSPASANWMWKTFRDAESLDDLVKALYQDSWKARKLAQNLIRIADQVDMSNPLVEALRQANPVHIGMHLSKRWFHQTFQGGNYHNLLCTEQDMVQVQFQDTDISKSHFKRCALNSLTLLHCHVEDLSITGSTGQVIMRYVDGSISLASSKLCQSDFRFCNLKSTGFLNSDLHRSEFYLCDLQDGEFTECDLSNALFINCKMANVLFASSNLKGCEFYCCDLENADFRGVDLSETKFTNCTRPEE